MKERIFYPKSNKFQKNILAFNFKQISKEISLPLLQPEKEWCLLFSLISSKSYNNQYCYLHALIEVSPIIFRYDNIAG